MSVFLSKVVKNSEGFRNSLNKIISDANQFIDDDSLMLFNEFKVNFDQSLTKNQLLVFGITKEGHENLLVVDNNSSQQKFDELQ